jgi:pre-mRNA-processing factor 8
VELKNLVINDYAKKNNVNVASLTQLEIRDIILGMEMAVPSVQQEQVNQVEGRNQEGGAVTVQTTNEHNQRITTTTTSNY